MGEIHRTEIDGLRATWRLNHLRQVEIMHVHNTSEILPTVTFGPGTFPDLVQARDQWPKQARLWDAVRHDLWMVLVPRYRASVTAGYPQ
ncbi:hypothetical protein OIE68_25225 [Nocardia vinacea]|uniref:hypothetical protein n=1 Tax=Nocardia vinacea TaxID=96468 RepID=UPI002E10E833|nr:hypothetical protein OIE68_25225 [Nocardia vinacea]